MNGATGLPMLWLGGIDEEVTPIKTEIPLSGARTEED
jgi:hypothetical protein